MKKRSRPTKVREVWANAGSGWGNRGNRKTCAGESPNVVKKCLHIGWFIMMEGVSGVSVEAGTVKDKRLVFPGLFSRVCR